MKNIKFYLLSLFISVICFNAFAQAGNTNEAPSKISSRVDKDSIQIKNFDGTYQEILKSIINALQTKDYVEIKSDSGIGLITASLPEEDLTASAAARTASAIASVFTLGIIGNDDSASARTRQVTINVNSLNPSLQKIRITIKETTTTQTQNWVSSTKRVVTDLTDQPKVYEELFNEIKLQLNFLKK
jgi:hypothetical protein